MDRKYTLRKTLCAALLGGMLFGNGCLSRDFWQDTAEDLVESAVDVVFDNVIVDPLDAATTSDTQ